ncbi:hypothetical protein [Rossellomorea aquimaris]|uniref:hypothetical protein n=1 Tax=Rossellomorea aquimaris TaxID=189382 RepID=UPI000B030931|nr:hypothetical protein [Rossellomorea aquimaris]
MGRGSLIERKVKVFFFFLSIAQWIVESHGGTITAFANKPSGTTFQVKLPK